MTTRRPLKDGQYSNNNDTANLGVPSFAQSVQSEDSSYPLDRAYTDDSIFSNDSQGVVMSSNTQDSSNSQDATSPGYTGSSKSARYKSAMTTRARQRRMRRIKERGSADDATPSTAANININKSNSKDPPGRVSPSGVLPPPSPSLATTDSVAVAKAKEHVEQMRLRNSPGGAPTTPTNLNSSGVEVGKGGHSPLQSRVYEKHRSRSRSASRKNKSSAPQGEMSSPPLPFPSKATDEKSMLVQTTSAQVKAKMTPEQMASQILAAKKAAADKAMLSRDSSGGSADPSIPAVARGNHHTRSNTDLTSNTSSRRKKASEAAPKPEDYIPDWKTTGSLNPQEVRDAANFTSVQFQCSNVSGEVEMFSDDGEGSDYFSGGEEGDSIFDNDGRGEKGVISPNIWESMADPKHATEIEYRNREKTSLPPSRWQNEVWSSNNNGGAHSDATTPSILHSGEIFHQKAAASIVSLLSPERMSGAGLMAPDIGSKEEDEKDVDVEGDSPQGVLDSPTKQHFTFDSDTPGSSRGGEWKGMTQINRTLFRDDLDDDVKQSMIFQAFRQNMIQPSDQLTDLLSQIHRKGNSIDRAFATRRKNACGALKILSAKDENRINLCWTVGVLPAIGSVLSDVNVDIHDDISRAANTEARNRIVSTLLNLSVNKKNRMLIVNTPGVLESMIQTILYDEGEGRQGCCTVLLYLAKTAETRKMIVKSAGMLECLSKVIEVPPEPVAPPKIEGKKGQISPSIQDGLQRKRLDNPDDEDTLEGMDTFGLKSQKKKSSSQHDSPGRYSVSESDATSHTGSHSGDDESQSVDSNHEEEKQLEIKTSPDDDDEKMAEDRYDADPNRFLHGARLSVFACLLCLVKSQECAFMVARDQIIVDSLSGVAERHLSPSHARAMAILAHLTRHPKNSHHLVFKYKTLLPTLQAACGSPDKEGSRYAFCALQNLSMDKSCRAPIAHSPNIIWSLTQKCKDESDSNDDEARIAAVAILQNLADEPANLIQFTIVKDCIGTIIRIAREDVVKGETTDLTSFMAKNTLATLSHWFRKIAQSGLDRMREKNGHSATTALFGANGVPLKNVAGVSSGIGGARSHSNLYEARLEPTVFNQWS